MTYEQQRPTQRQANKAIDQLAAAARPVVYATPAGESDSPTTESENQ